MTSLTLRPDRPLLPEEAEELRAALRAAEADRDAALKERETFRVSMLAEGERAIAALKERDEARDSLGYYEARDLAAASYRDALLAAERARGDRMAEAAVNAIEEVAANARLTLIHAAASKHREEWARNEINSYAKSQIDRIRALAAPSPDAAKEP